MALIHSPNTVRDGLVMMLDAANNRSYLGKTFVRAKIYSVFGASARSANYSVQYSDDNSNWTTAFSGIASNNTSCGIQFNSGAGDGSYGPHRYWRYVEGSAVVLHHPRVSRIILTDDTGADSNLIVYTSDNCSDSGTYIVGTTTATDFGASTWYDLSGNGNNGTLTNGPTFNSSDRGNIILDGSNDYISVANSSSLAFTSGVSVSAWVKFSTLSSRQMIAEKHTSPSGGWWFAAQNNKIIWLVVTSSTTSKYIDLTNNTTLSTGVIYNIVGTYNASAGTLVLYVNGVNDGGTVVGSGTGTTNSTNPLNIGAQINWGPGYSSNTIYSMAIYNRQLSAEEVLQNFNATRRRFGV